MIGYAEQKGSEVYAFSETGGYKWCKSGILMGYTSSTVTIKKGHAIFTFDEQGEVKFIR